MNGDGWPRQRPAGAGDALPRPEELAGVAGTRKVIEVGRKIIGRGQYGEEGTDHGPSAGSIWIVVLI